MTKEEFISIAQQSSDRVDMLSKMGHKFSNKNIETYIKIPRQAFGIKVKEMFEYFSQPSISKDIYISHLSGSKSKTEVLEKMGYPINEENITKYVVDTGVKFGIHSSQLKAIFAQASSTGSIGI
jgi:PleD family two-component response regulator